MELETAILRRRMCRAFLPGPVSRDALDRALALAAHAPSAGNTQGWAFVVLEDDDRDLFWRYQADEAWLARQRHPGLLDAGALVLPLGSRLRYVERYSEADKAAPERVGQWAVPYWLLDTAFATMLLLLALSEEGLGALFFALRKPAAPLLDALGVPGDWEPIGALAVGRAAPGEPPSGSSGRQRPPMGGVVHRGRWSG